MKKYFAMMAFAAMSLCMFSCGDDDEEGGGGNGGGSGSGNTSAGVLDHASDTRITKAGDFTFIYDEKGRLSSVSKYGETRFELTYNPNRWTSGYDEMEEASVSYNGNGYLSAMKSTFDWTEEEGTKWETRVSGTASVNFSYDGSGHVTGATSTSKETVKDDEGTRTYDTNVKITVTWKSNMLTKVVLSGKEVKKSAEGTENDVWTETYNFTYDKSVLLDNENKHHQYVHSIADWMDSFEALAYVGIMGRGPLYLPNAGEETEVETDDGETDEDYDSYTYSYSFNSNGSVRSCSVRRNGNSYGDNYSYSYETIGDDDYNSRSFTSTRSSFVKHGHNAPVADMIRSFCRRK